jgi:hypothetical protein
MDMTKRRWRGSVPAIGLAAVVIGLLVSVSSARRASADAPLCRYSIGMTTVVDNETTLTWQRVVDNQPYTWAQADTYCKTLNLDGSVWRLPTLHELQSIVDESKVNPAIDEAVFPFTLNTFFWSSVHYVPDSNAAWGIDFAGGDVGRNGVVGDSRVRCVR